MRIKQCLFLIVGVAIHSIVSGQDVYEKKRESWLNKAEILKPVLTEMLRMPQRTVLLFADSTAHQGWKAIPDTLAIEDLYSVSFRKQKEVIVDFGEHITGYFTCDFKLLERVADAPLKLKFIFGETPSELATPFDPYSGTLSRGWLQDEYITVQYVPSAIRIDRRLSFRYVKIELLGSSPYYDFCISGMNCTTTTSAVNQPEVLSDSVPEIIAAIDRIALSTLKECMQTVYEDGPKRDQRLWIGDLYLEALANNYSYRNHDLTKRCLYLLAALSAPDGFLHATVFEKPFPHPQKNSHCLDYSLLWNTTLLNYLEATNDKETAIDLWEVAKKQIEHASSYINKDFLFDTSKPIWLFFDWKDKLDKQTSIQGLIIKTLKDTYLLAKMIGREKEISHYLKLAEKLTASAQQHFYHKEKGVFICGENEQISYSSQIWMILSGVVNQKRGKQIMNSVMQMEEAYYPGSPYSTHYLIEALLQCDMKKEARDCLINYWGAMVMKGADTFWEVFDPKNEYASPYKFYPMNSYCHAWSCTPVYFIRKYPDVFQ